MADIALQDLKSKLERLGVNVRLDATVHRPLSPPPPPPFAASGLHAVERRSGSGTGASRTRKDVADLLHKIDNVEVAMTAAEAMSHVAQNRLEGEIMRSPVLLRSSISPDRADRPARLKKPAARKPKLPKAGLVSTAMAAAAARPHGGSNAYALSASQPHLQGLPLHTPLSSVLAQYKQAEATWAQEKARLRREADEERRRANKCDLELKKNQRLLEHKRLDVKALKAALKNRDNQLAASGERIKELEEAMGRTQHESAARLAALNAERDDLKALLLASLQRLEAVDEMVARADMSSSVMQEKLATLEQERLRALEAAARARAEVQELSESRRKLQWQSKLLEKMSEVQLKHNRHKSEAIRRLLSQPTVPGDGESDFLGEEDSSMMADIARLNLRTGL